MSLEYFARLIAETTGFPLGEILWLEVAALDLSFPSMQSSRRLTCSTNYSGWMPIRFLAEEGSAYLT